MLNQEDLKDVFVEKIKAFKHFSKCFVRDQPQPHMGNENFLKKAPSPSMINETSSYYSSLFSLKKQG